jgi:hypothetical protein
MVLGCFPDADVPERTMETLREAPFRNMSANLCAGLARARNLSVFGTQSSDW